MEKEKHVCAVKYAKELKELGYPQDDSSWYWVRFGDNPFEIFSQEFLDSFQEKDWSCVKEHYAAPTVGELGERLPRGFYTMKDAKGDFSWFCTEETVCDATTDNQLWADSEVNARVKMYIYLIKNKIIKKEEQ